ncbi:MAG: 4-oxalocrotonate tautomerase family protein [Methanobrevibacter sp.]|uniref:4-oxalocrotonate tautomerase DmpI n=1 Tax=Methanobrevibacter sp. TaxID=66852 RepID=UPI001B251372|nr:4-oxalocrotonate tautomerase DmpI [Methanobrevibacter sp.]MBO6111054.1 4-oxalocrotonate tautomerase family protein [Methanobrevibacter sp.]MBP3791200.1 4-oxalocrotonate tautomerase family protein [Methanobrevibacter sp.]
MPSITFDINQLSEDQKQQIVEEFTQSASRITGIPEEFFYVFINEFPDENVGVGGKLLSKK